MSTSPPRRCNGHEVGRFRVGREDGVRGTLTIKSLTPDVQKFLVYAVNGIYGGGERVTSDPRILRALCNAWDGTEAGIGLLAITINALAPVIRQAQVKDAQAA